MTHLGGGCDLLGVVGTGISPTPARMVAITHQDGGYGGDHDPPVLVAMTWQGVSHHLLQWWLDPLCCWPWPPVMGMVAMTQQDRSHHLLGLCPSSIRMMPMTSWDGGHEPLGWWPRPLG